MNVDYDAIARGYEDAFVTATEQAAASWWRRKPDVQKTVVSGVQKAGLCVECLLRLDEVMQEWLRIWRLRARERIQAPEGTSFSFHYGQRGRKRRYDML